MRIGVIGSGISGLTAAWALDQEGHDVELLEAGDKVGMAAHSLDLDLDGVTRVGDVPSRMFNHRQWPQLCRLYDRLGVSTIPVDASQTLCDVQGACYLKLENGLRPGMGASLLWDRHARQLLRAAATLQRDGRRDLAAGLVDEITLQSYLAQSDVPERFVYDVLYPSLASTVCTCSYQSLDRYPASLVLQLLSGLTDETEALLKTTHGTRDVVDRLLQGGVTLRLQTLVEQVEAIQSDRVEIKIKLPSGQTQTESYDQVVVATQANHARDLLCPSDEGLFQQEREILAMFDYERVPVVVHRDHRLLPARSADWATFNMVSRRAPDPAAMCTVWMNRFHADWKLDGQSPAPDVFQTINPLWEPESGTLIREAVLERPVVNHRTQLGWDRLGQLQERPGRRLWFCGSYAAAGVPLLETGVVSALQIAQRIRSHSRWEESSSAGPFWV